MQQGIIKKVDFEKGLGYVQSNDGKEIVLITLGLEDQLTQGKDVEFDIRQTRYGIIAVNIHPAELNH